MNHRWGRIKILIAAPLIRFSHNSVSPKRQLKTRNIAKASGAQIQGMAQAFDRDMHYRSASLAVIAARIRI
jgi:hypothetical protein